MSVETLTNEIEGMDMKSLQTLHGVRHGAQEIGDVFISANLAERMTEEDGSEPIDPAGKLLDIMVGDPEFSPVLTEAMKADMAEARRELDASYGVADLMRATEDIINTETAVVEVDSLRAHKEQRDADESLASQDATKPKAEEVERGLYEADISIETDNHTLFEEIEELKPVEVDDEYGGSIFSAKEKGFGGEDLRDLSTLQMRKIMEQVGYRYKFDDNQNVVDVMMPTPDRLLKAAELNKVPVSFQNKVNKVTSIYDGRKDDGKTPIEDFDATVKSGENPVGVANLEYYLHDIEGDHMPAVALLKEKLFELFDNDESNFHESRAAAYDGFTASITAALKIQFKGTETDQDKAGYNTMLQLATAQVRGGEIGFDPDFTAVIDSTIQQALYDQGIE